MSKSSITKKDDSKLIDTLVIIGIVFLIGSLILMFTKKGGQTDDDIGNNIVEINYKEYSEKIKEDEYNIFLLTSPTCSHCVNYKPYVNSVASQYKLTVYDINLSSLEYDEYVSIHDKYSAIRDKYSENHTPGIPTPVTVITKNGEEVTSITGDIGASGFLNLLKTYNVIK